MKTRDHGLSEKEMELVKLIMAECESTGDIQAKLKRLFAGTIEQMLEAEMDEHLGYEKHSAAGNNSGNSRNGYGKKTISSDYGECEIAVPRDRNGEFEPKIIEKRQTRTDEIEQKIMAMYAKGMSQRDIEDTLHEIYGSEISQGLISRITDKILPEVNEWQNRPLDSIYPIVFFDGMELTKELWIDRRESSKSLTWSSVLLAFEKTEGKPLVERPKALGDIRGVSYIYGIFRRFGLIETPQKYNKHN